MTVLAGLDGLWMAGHVGWLEVECAAATAILLSKAVFGEGPASFIVEGVCAAVGRA